MSDIVDRLRAVEGDTTKYHRNPDGPEAADEIERLREALRRIVEYCANDGLPNEMVAERVIDRVDEEARTALKESGDE